MDDNKKNRWIFLFGDHPMFWTWTTGIHSHPKSSAKLVDLYKIGPYPVRSGDIPPLYGVITPDTHRPVAGVITPCITSRCSSCIHFPSCHQSKAPRPKFVNMRSELSAKVPKFQRQGATWIARPLRNTEVYAKCMAFEKCPLSNITKNKAQVTYILARKKKTNKHVFKMSSPHRSHDANPGTPWNRKTTIFQDSQASKEMDRNGISSSSGSLQNWFLLENFLGVVSMSMSIFAIPEEIWKSFFNKQPAPWVSSWTNEASKCPKRLHSDTVSVPKWRYPRGEKKLVRNLTVTVLPINYRTTTVETSVEGATWNSILCNHLNKPLFPKWSLATYGW